MPAMSASPAARTAPAGPAGPAIESVLESISVALAVLRPRMDAVSLAIHARPELKFAEFHARDVLTGWLGESGFTVRVPAGDLDTAFVAVHEGAEPGPCVAVLAEYDALPGVGHGCGHNLIAAGARARRSRPSARCPPTPARSPSSARPVRRWAARARSGSPRPGSSTASTRR
ncbi:hypothetical protein [Parafrankia sp. BMG5.11]|uniref:hypothetical protein n=1 Tax=Parafrankia sp. BMG5.11 TaxID=222540 RepID=UPI001FB3DA79|nr:hypothetical protein [Parafrankia sp. BMG5.11]